MTGRKTVNRLEHMLDDAIKGTFKESDYDESVLSRVECKWKQFLGASVLSKESLEREKNNVKELVSDISHQTKTPMANIRLYVELLREGLAAGNAGDTGAAFKSGIEERRVQNIRLLEEIERQTEKLDFLIQSLTKLSRLESDVVEVKPEHQEIAGLLTAVVADMRPRAQKKGIELVNTYTGCRTACYDKKWTKEALGNVLDNAVKYSPEGSRVVLSVTEYEMYVAISVKDEGMGIRGEDMAKIFRRFYRAEAVQQEDGAGIGLYLAREILKREKGYIKVKSKPGCGAEFILYLAHS